MKKNSSGKVLGVGAHGCAILSKPLNCHNIQSDKLIKLNISKEDFVSEINNTLLVNFIDKSKTSIKLEDACITDISTLNDIQKKYLDDCGMNKDLLVDNKIYQIIYNKKDIGIDLIKLLDKNIITLEKLLALSLRLYESLYLYSKYNICFMDIKPDNVIYLQKEDKLKFIDYGVISNFRDVLYDTNYPYSQYNYPYYPPELKMIYSINHNESYQVFYEKFIKNFMFIDVKYLKDKLFTIYDDYNNDLLETFTYLENIKKDNPLKNIQDYFSFNDISKIHLYSLSMMVFNIIIMYDVNKYEIKDKTFISNFIKKIIIPSISFNYKNRISIEESINRIKSLKTKDKNITKIIKDEKLLDNIKLLNKKTKKPIEKIPSTTSVKSVKKSKTDIKQPLQEQLKLDTKKFLKFKTKKDVINGSDNDIFGNKITENIKTNIVNCNKTKSYYLILAKRLNIKNRYKMKKKDICTTLLQKI